ncbi:MAG: hypothetical protein F6K63_28840 [Moorea sp. SIO1G6]|uniref:Uncharacterized protein n=1 Tax=Moorena producens (strain JHB) TaxID=1454205 RepID=A0A1D9G4S3_MOOP1|nr:MULTISPECIES: hypothetical protein [Moorena]AOY82410.1 hypothetical protein BJP36_23370 [Moorena producens JHB]NET68181.1 hypothetical protein [Moorena sp. SIO1G6]
MFDFNILCDFSRNHCVAICAILVPANLLLTLQSIIFTVIGYPQVQVRKAALLACIPALAVIFHVCSWLMIGVVMAPTYILFTLGGICLSINVWAINHSTRMAYHSSSQFGEVQNPGF